jgi:cytochrome c-type biogenesis protein CcmH
MRRLALVVAILALSGPARAVTPDEQLKDPRLEARARAISQELRCVVCQNQSIDDSEAPLAHDLRVILRERIAAGDSDDQAKAYLVQRYGHFVLLKPPFEPATWALWLGPALILALGGAGVAMYWREHSKGPAEMTPSDEAELASLMASAEDHD